MCDIDDFKKVNDEYGHQKGDRVLKKVSKIIKNTIRNVDIAGRYGGEEFLMIFPNTTYKKAENACQRIRKKIQKESMVTISIGIAGISDETTKEIVKKVDDCLYKAKSKGKNCVYFIGEEME